MKCIQLYPKITSKDIKVSKKIGSGKFSDVYLSNSDPNKVIKIIKSSYNNDIISNELKNMIVHLYLLSKYPDAKKYIPNIYNFGFMIVEDNIEFYFIIYNAGNSLIRYDIEDMHSTIDIMSQLAKCVKFLHKNNLVHRDIKPHNISLKLINEKPKILLLDLGTIGYKDIDIDKDFKTESLKNLKIAIEYIHKNKELNKFSFLEDNKIKSDCNIDIDSGELNCQNRNIGTLLYFAPELIKKHSLNFFCNQIKNDKLGKSLDIWSLGLTFLNVLTNDIDIYGRYNDQVELFYQICGNKYKDKQLKSGILESILPEYIEILNNQGSIYQPIILGMLEYDQDLRMKIDDVIDYLNILRTSFIDSQLNFSKAKTFG